MEQVAYVFPGQGAQSVGMGKELCESYSEAKEVFDKASEILKFDLGKLCFEGPNEELTRTSNAQVAILVHSVAALRVLEKTFPEKYAPRFAFGLSLGEYSALVASGSLGFDDAVSLVRKRGIYMQKACDKNPGKMASIIGMDLPELEKLCRGFGCEIANLNSPGQVVISGSSSSVELTASMAKEKGAKRAIMLEVGGAFHSSLMTSAREKLEGEINSITFNAPKYPVISNVKALPTTDPDEIKQNLISQVNSTTLLCDSVKYASSKGITTYLEIGPGAVIKGLIRKIDRSFNVINFDKPGDFNPAVEA